MNTLLTRCPVCGTTFRASAEQLTLAAGWVRCGQCDGVFDARANVAAESPASATPGNLNVAYIESLLDEESTEPANAEAGAEPTAVTAASDPVTATHVTTAPLARLPIEFDGTQRRRSPLRVLGWAAAVAAVVVAMAAQYVWLERDRLSQDPDLRMRLEQACKWTGCRLEPYHDPLAIRSRELLVRPDPARAGVLLVDAVLENSAPFAQRYPVLELSFTDIRGTPVARRAFKPDEYLGAAPDPAALIAPRKPVRVHLELKDPGEHATNYELRLLDGQD